MESAKVRSLIATLRLEGRCGSDVASRRRVTGGLGGSVHDPRPPDRATGQHTTTATNGNALSAMRVMQV